MSGLRALAAAAALCLSPAVFAQVTVTEAWVRGTVPAQTVTGAFMRLKSAQPMALVGAESPAAGRVEIHEMRMDGDMMRMRPLARLELSAGKELSLEPGGYHLMLFELKQALQPGGSVPLKLRFEGAGGAVQNVEVKAVVRPIGGSTH